MPMKGRQVEGEWRSSVAVMSEHQPNLGDPLSPVTDGMSLNA